MSWANAAGLSGPFVLAVISAAGLALTHYRIAMIYAAFVALYLAWVVFVAIRQRKSASQVLQPVARTAIVAVLTRGRVLAEGDYQTVSANPTVREAYLGVGHA